MIASELAIRALPALRCTFRLINDLTSRCEMLRNGMLWVVMGKG